MEATTEAPTPNISPIPAAIIKSGAVIFTAASASLPIPFPTNINIDADLGGTTAGRELYEEIDGGYVDKMSFSFICLKGRI